MLIQICDNVKYKSAMAASHNWLKKLGTTCTASLSKDHYNYDIKKDSQKPSLPLLTITPRVLIIRLSVTEQRHISIISNLPTAIEKRISA